MDWQCHIQQLASVKNNKYCIEQRKIIRDNCGFLLTNITQLMLDTEILSNVWYWIFNCCFVIIYSFHIQYIPRNMHTVFALLCFVVVIHWLIFPYPSGLLHWYCGNLTIAPVPAKQPWWIWINTSYEFIMNDCITTTKQSTTKPCAYISWDIL